MAERHRALAASLVAIIIIYRASSSTLSLVPTIILVRTTPRPSAGTLPLCFANRIDFRNLSRGRFSLCPLAYGRPNTRAMVYRYRRIRARTTHIRSQCVYATGRPRINFLRIINQRAGRGGAHFTPRVRKQRRGIARRPAGKFANSSVRFKQIDQQGLLQLAL